MNNIEYSELTLYGVNIRIDTLTGYYNVNDLFRAYKNACDIQGWGNRSFVDAIKTQKFASKVFYIVKDRGLINDRLNDYLIKYSYPNIYKVMYDTNIMYGEPKHRYADEMLFMIIASELNEAFFIQVIDFFLNDK